MKKFVSVLIAVFLVSLFAFSQVGPGNVKNIEAAFETQSKKIGDNSHIAINPGNGNPQPSPDEGVETLQLLIISYKQTIEAQKTEINRLNQELKTCQDKQK